MSEHEKWEKWVSYNFGNIECLSTIAEMLGRAIGKKHDQIIMEGIFGENPVTYETYRQTYKLDLDKIMEDITPPLPKPKKEVPLEELDGQRKYSFKEY